MARTTLASKPRKPKASTPAAARASPPQASPARVVVPVRYAAWLSGDLGRELETTLASGLAHLVDLRLTRLPRGFLVEADEAIGPLLEATHRAVSELEEAVRSAYPVFHHEMGPVWTGTLQAVFTEQTNSQPAITGA